MDPSILSDVAFDPVDRARWLALVDKALGPDAGYESLVSRTDDAIAVEPLYERVAGAARVGRVRADADWDAVQRIDDPDPERANRQALDDVAGGATGLTVVFAGAPNAFGYGLPATPEALAAALADVPLGKVRLRIDVHPQSRGSIDWLAELLAARRVDPARTRLSFGIDPAALFAGTGRLRMSIEALKASMPQSLAGFFAMGLPAVLLESDGRVFHNAGASEAQELAAMLASAVSHLRMFEEARQPLVYAAPHIGFALAVDQDLVLSMAKLRALRKLWARVLEACSVEPTATVLHAETSYRMLTSRDPETNILRNTIAASAAALGGADSLSVLPHTLPHGLPDGFARRLARNTQLVLAEESHLGFVADPGAGAGGLEALTEALCEAAWSEFTRIEAEGGVLRSLEAGRIQERVEATRRERLAAYAGGDRHIVGTTIYPLDTERPVSTLEAERMPMPSDGTVFCRQLTAERLDEGLAEQEAVA
ncbi:methylmalonyl-CoA mutase family protein [Aquibium sp. A9E412]|uniref:methylmalonyl-CoA mutase family protein n=1 Tax=Aquibium sp. A9E412 TaxID=2976767 RepID=UPI0025AFE1BE|nr:methylmalonyl-CoA mutase family protein [Aquibium sp. A9E412]MDN2566378.1 methylmalonyl-CoA mutase family protein [Aquibium sp. A9E412]